MDDHGRLIARWDEAEQCWRPAEGRNTGFACHSPMITASPVHPNPRQGGIPNKSDSEPWRSVGYRAESLFSRGDTLGTPCALRLEPITCRTHYQGRRPRGRCWPHWTIRCVDDTDDSRRPEPTARALRADVLNEENVSTLAESESPAAGEILFLHGLEGSPQSAKPS